MASRDLVRPSRDGDQFHYHWAARQCLQLLPGVRDLVAVTLEGTSEQEADGDKVKGGEELIDVGLYFGAEELDRARLVQYIQLKHSTRHVTEPWTASGLEKTINGFAQRYVELVQRFDPRDVTQRFRFEFTTNRPIASKVKQVLADLASGGVGRHPELQRSLVKFTGLDETSARLFFGLFSATGDEKDLWAQKNLLTRDVATYLPDADYDAPIQLKELVTRKATTEFASNPSIRRHDVLRALKASEEQLAPSPCLIPGASDCLPREQEPAIRRALLDAKSPLVIHAAAGVGKSVLAARLAATMPSGSEAVLYDCFGDGRYRNALHFRHRHRDALVQIANELAARGLCHPLVPTAHADAKQYMLAFVSRLAQAVSVLHGKDPEARLCLIIDAADNADMAAEEQREPGSFVRDLIRTQLPDGVRLAFTCRTHRRGRLNAPAEAQEVELQAFTHGESADHLRKTYPSACDAEVSEFALLSSSNPRVQAFALSQGLSMHELLKQLGPEPTTVERAIGDLLTNAIAKLRDRSGTVESSQIDVICQGLAVLRPPVPIPVLARLSRTSDSEILSFALDLGRPLLVKGNSLHFLDEPSETWFRDRFQPDPVAFTAFLDRLRPLTAQSSYAAGVLPQLLLHAGRLDELVELALSGENLPSSNPLERRDVEVQRLIFALRACLRQGNHVAAAKLALRAGGECAGETRQNRLLQKNTDVAAVLMAPDRIAEVVARRTFGSAWMGSRHAYDAGLFAGREEFLAEAASSLRMAIDWLDAWTRLPAEKRRSEPVADADIAELALVVLRLRGPKAAARWLRGWTPRHHALEAGRRIGRRLIDLSQYEHLDALTEAASNDVWLLLGLAEEARAVGHHLPAEPLSRLLRLLADRRVQLPESRQWGQEWTVLNGVRSAVELGLQVLPRESTTWAAVLRRYLPAVPPPDLAGRFETSSRTSLLQAYALEAALRRQQLSLIEVAPPDIRKQLEARDQHNRSQESDFFQHAVGALLPLFVLCAEISCGRSPNDLGDAIERAVKEASSSQARSARPGDSLLQTGALAWLRIMRDSGTAKPPDLKAFTSAFDTEKNPLWPDTLISLCRSAARAEGFASLAIDFAALAYEALEASRDDAESRADSYVGLARAILSVSSTDAGCYFDRAVEIASRVGDENLNRWAALLRVATAAAVQENPRSRTAYRLARVAELTYEYVSRDKHFDWHATVEALADLCGSSALAILSRWRDRRFGSPERLLPTVIYRLIDQDRLPVTTPIAFGGVMARWDRLADLRRALAADNEPTHRSLVAQIAYRYMRVQPANRETWCEIKRLGGEYHIEFPDVDRLLAIERSRSAKEIDPSTFVNSDVKLERRSPDWNALFHNVNLTDAAALRSAYVAVRTYDAPYEFETFFREAFARAKTGRQPELIQTIASWPDFGIFELRDLLNALPSSLPQQPSLRRALREAVLLACQRAPQHVHWHGWGVLQGLEMLDRQGVVSRQEVARATLAGFAAQVDTLDAAELFQLLEPLATCLIPDQADDVLNFGLDLLEVVLRPEDGDGPWRSALEPSESLIGALAGYTWAGLGSPVVAERWQYAHVVRCAAELGWSAFIGALIAIAEANSAQPFVDLGLEFYVFHARQWLLIGLARGALENPAALRPAIPMLQNYLREEHVLIRELAAMALRALAAAGELNHDDMVDLESVNRPSHPEILYSGWQTSLDDEVSSTDQTLDDKAKYYFGLDIGPYWLAPLGRTFGLGQATIERRVLSAIRTHLGWRGDFSWRSDARRTRKIFAEGETHHTGGALPPTDDLTAYQGYHGMMSVAAALLRERSVRRNVDEPSNGFGEWLSQYLLTRTDSRWLADRRDPRLVADPRGPERVYSDNQWRWSVTADYLDQLLTTDDGMVVVWGHWHGGENEYTEKVAVRSALVSRAGVEALVAALQTAPNLGHLMLPGAGEPGEMQAGSLKLKGWVSHNLVSDRLDEGDVWGSRVLYPGLAPSENTVGRLGLIQQSDGRTWACSSHAGLLRSEKWTHEQRDRSEVETISGERLCADSGFVEHLLVGHSEDSLVLSIEVRRSVPRHASKDDEFETYALPYARYYLMGADGVFHALKSGS